MTAERSREMMLLKQLFLAFAGITAGSVIAAGIFAFLAIIGVFPRVIDKTKTRRHIMLYETLLILGGSVGNALDLLEFPIPIGSIPAAGHFLGLSLLGLGGLSFGVFIGCLVMSLAETVKAVPVLNRRLRLSVGIQYMTLSIALGKLAGSLLYFYRGFGGGGS